ncbi:unnamed protein product [Alopecurus aequalis]
MSSASVYPSLSCCHSSRMETMTPLKEISKNSYRSKVLARLARIWDFRNPQTGALYEIGFVLVDRQGGTIEGLIPAVRAELFRSQLKEGNIYTIDRFNIYDAKKTDKSVDHPYRICFTQRTIVKEVLPQPENFPLFAYNTFPFSVLAGRMDENVLLSDVVGLVREVTEVNSPSGPNKQQKRNIFITDGKDQAVVTLWGQLANNFDVEGLQEASSEEPIIVLFIGMTVSQFSGMLAFKSTSVTRWYINIPINEMAAIRESTKTLPHQIEWHGSGQNRREPTETTIAEVAQLEPNDIMGERYKMKIQITEIVSANDWWYMGCRDCWKKAKIEGDTYKSPRCPISVPVPRFRILLNAVDVDVADATIAPMAEFTFFGPHGETIVGKDAVMVVANARGQANYVPPELTNLIDRKFVVTVTPSDRSLDANYMYYQVQAVEPLQEDPPVNQPSAAQTIDQASSSSSTPPRASSATAATPPPTIEATPPSTLFSTSQATEKSVTTKDTGKRGSQQSRQDNQKKGRTVKELKYPAEE